MLDAPNSSPSGTAREAPVPVPSQTPSSSTSRTGTAINSPPAATRHRHPVPPSPLSRIQSEPGHSSVPAHRVNGQGVLESTSPCFIHSLLDRHGSMQDWLKSKSNHPSPNSKNQQAQSQNGSAPPQPSHSNSLARNPSQSQSNAQYSPSLHQRPSIQDSAKSPTFSASGSNGPSPPLSGRVREASGSGYSSDKSSTVGGSAILDGDLMDDEEEASSLTRQLAETAQGVREMSKELGRTRVRSKIQHILIVTKARDNRLIKLTRELALYLMLKKPASTSEIPSRPGSNDRGIVVYVDAQLRSSKRFDAAGMQREHPQLFEPVGRRRSSSTTSMSNLSAYPSSASLNDSGKRRDEGQLRYWTGEMCSNSPHLFDFVVTLGGDGTVLFTSWLFQRIVPPVLPFALGSLGFLTCFDFANYKSTMDRVIDDGIRVNLRMRFTCTVYRAIAPEEAAKASAKGNSRKAIKKAGGEILMSQVDRSGWEALEGPPGLKDGENCIAQGKDKEIMCYSTRPVEQFEVLNDLVVDRGPSPFVSLLELFGDEHHLTTVQADGLTVSTPTGSTAYSLSAGGSLVHPQIPAILITPICPHTLSFRPMLLPDSMELRICVPYNSRSTAWASFDGRGRVELKQGDHIKVTASKYPFPTVCADKASTDWFNSISRTLRWNEREKQKSFVVIEEDNEPAASTNKSKKRAGSSWEGARKGADRTHEELREEDEDAMEEEGDVEEDEADDDDEEEEEEDEFDIDDKSGGEKTNPSSPTEKPIEPKMPALSKVGSSSHKSGVDSPDRFAKPYQAPPPLSQRHLVEALAAAEIESKEGEVGQRDEIRSDPSEMRVDGSHFIPSGRSASHGPTQDPRNSSSTHGSHHQQPRQVPSRPPNGRSMSDISGASSRPGRKKKEACKAKAFAFFGQDDSASDNSDEASET